ncbi:MFS transporter [bacterium]|nr:MFS transporter [bacterium]
MKNLIKLLLEKPLFLRALLALFVSGIGTAFTSVAVYQTLSTMNWGASGFGLAFAAGLLPGMLTSTISGKHSYKWPVGKMLVAGQIIGLMALLFPIFGTGEYQIWWLLLSEVLASAVSGLLIPIFKSLERSSFEEDQFPSLASIDTFIITANFILGQGVGALLVSHLSLTLYLLFDVASYLIALILLWPLARKLKSLSAEEEPGSDHRLPSFWALKPDQKKVLFLMNWLPLVTVPLMVTLPARGLEFGASSKVVGFLTMTPALFLICGRTAGQILGPMVALKMNMERISQKSWSLSLALFLYIFGYTLAFLVPSLHLAVLCCMFAHLASNVVYSVGNFQLMKSFSASEIGWAAGFLYRSASLIMGVVALLAGLVAAKWGWISIIAFSLVAWLFGVLFWRKNVA